MGSVPSFTFFYTFLFYVFKLILCLHLFTFFNLFYIFVYETERKCNIFLLILRLLFFYENVKTKCKKFLYKPVVKLYLYEVFCKINLRIFYIILRKKIYTFLRFTFNVIFLHFLCYCLRKFFFKFYFTFAFTFYLVFLHFCKIKIRRRKIFVISFFEISLVNFYYTFTFTFG